MKSIKENKMITKVLQAAQITNESRHLKMTFTKMVSLYGQQIEESYTVERHFATLISSIAALLNGKISPLLISPKEITDTEFCTKSFNIIRISCFKTTTPLLLRVWTIYFS